MKSLISLILLLSSLSSFSAHPLKVDSGTFTLYDEPFYQENGTCDVGSVLFLTETDQVGKVAILRDFVAGVCLIYIAPNERVYLNLSVSDYGCGSKLVKGQRVTKDGLINIEIVDHRLRLCDDLVAGSIIVTEKSNDVEQILYSKN